MINLDNEISRCNRCGFCQSVCPTYACSQDETQVARGRIQLLRLLKNGKYDFRNDQGIAEKVDDCLLCGACVLNCPASVRTDQVMIEAREKFISTKGLSLFHRLVYRGVLSHRERLDRSSTLIRLYNKSGLRNILYQQILRKALDRLIYLESFLPSQLKQQPAKKILPEVSRPNSKPKMRIAFFIGCASNVFIPRTVELLVRYLVKRGVEVHLPKNGCCGQPHLSMGDRTEARRLARKNIELFFNNNYDFIVSDCSTCAHSLANYDSFFSDNSPEVKKIRPQLPKVMEINTLVYQYLGLSKNNFNNCGKKVTYHDSCHAVRGLLVKQAPREILKSSGLELVEMKDADSCCGGAGAYSFSHSRMSERIGARKVENIIASGSEILAVSCPSCTLQLGAALKRAGSNIEIKHPIELLAEAESEKVV